MAVHCFFSQETRRKIHAAAAYAVGLPMAVLAALGGGSNCRYNHCLICLGAPTADGCGRHRRLLPQESIAS